MHKFAHERGKNIWENDDFGAYQIMSTRNLEGKHYRTRFPALWRVWGGLCVFRGFGYSGAAFMDMKTKPPRRPAN